MTLPYRTALVGQSPQVLPVLADPNASPALSVDDITRAIRQITPTLLVVGIASGAAFAIGGVLVSRYVFPERARRGRR